MYYDTYRKKDRNRRRRRERTGCLGWLMRALLKLLAAVLVLALVAAGLLYAMPVSLMNVEPADMNLSPTDGLPGSRVNILLLGLDFLSEGQQRSDAMIIASIGYDGVRLTSVMRDTMVDIPGYGRHKLNSAYTLGGAELTMRTINQTFDLNITNYAAIEFRALVDLVDAVGGVDISIEENEIEYLNKYAWNTYKKIITQDAEKYSHYADSVPVTQTGKLHLDGLFATAYTRIRYSDSDYMRTARQREVISAALTAMRGKLADPRFYADLYAILQDSVQTNLTLPELISLGEKAVLSGNIETNRVPMNEHLRDDGSGIIITKPEENIRSLHEFIYG